MSQYTLIKVALKSYGYPDAIAHLVSVYIDWPEIEVLCHQIRMCEERNPYDRGMWDECMGIIWKNEWSVLPKNWVKRLVDNVNSIYSPLVRYPWKVTYEDGRKIVICNQTHAPRLSYHPLGACFH